MKKFTPTLLSLALTMGLSAGANAHQSGSNHSHSPQQEVQLAISKKTNHAANEVYEKIFMDSVMASPIYQTYLGIKKDYGKWDDISPAAADKDLERTKKHQQWLAKIDPSKLTGQSLLSYNLLKDNLQAAIDDHKWHLYNYPVNQMFGQHSGVPSLLINQHLITNEADAKAYISRLEGVSQYFNGLIASLEARAAAGIIAPKFVFAHVLRDSKNIITGAPFDKYGEDSTLWSDFKGKIEKLDISDAKKQTLLLQAKSALIGYVGPAYNQLIATVESLEARADNKDGVWKLPDGDAFYKRALEKTTTTSLTSDEIHNIGLAEVERIHGEMRAIMKQVDFDGSLQDFFKFMRDDQQFYYPETKEGKEAYIADAITLIEGMEARLDEVFGIKPKAPMIVKAVEPFREKSAGKAFYQQPAPDGSRPGTYYANLYDMKAMPKYQMEALAFHEGTPGHHMQIAIAQELEGVPKFRRFGGYTAYIEGWGLYSEYFPKEMGFYSDPYSDFGRLAMELWRACRLVVDTGIHTKKWTREQGIEYYVTNTPNAKSDAVKMVERHIVMPSQATAYKIGMLKIQELRADAKKQLGDKFDIRGFHDTVLKNGPVPLDVLETEVQKWVEASL
ncbi:DUF885 family protein [Paraferrimonas sp. SM1919]|uniref:DUF885 domain-containing protein n=1 Tax=Paraferrimonas sp. SM1919 TaxID=2662263 RepID=UPI0013D175CB|nr:DUF885 domain-containing protein [Paraferrimonas sp. SM1919]